jgi:hypothetical protein
LPTKLPEGDAEVAWNSFPAPPPVTEAELISFIQRFRRTVDDYNQAARERRTMGAAAHRSDADSFIVFFLPLSVSLALALQATKITYDAWFKPRD